MVDHRHGWMKKTQGLGKWQFVFLWGVCFWGISTALLSQALMMLIGDGTSISLQVSLVVFPLAGIVFGLTMYKAVEGKGSGQANETRRK